MFNQLPFASLFNASGKFLRSIVGCFMILVILGIVAVVACSAVVGFNIGTASESPSITPTPTVTPRPTVAISTYTPVPAQTVQPGSVLKLEGVGESTGFLAMESGIYTVRLTVVGNDRRFAPDTYEFNIGANAAEFVLEGRDRTAMVSGRYTVHESGERAWTINVGDDARWTVTFEPVE